MPNIDSATLRKNDFMQAFGNCVQFDGQHALAANPVAGDDIRIMVIPAGTKVQSIALGNDDLDSNASPTLVHSLGFAPVVPADGPALNATYFAPAGQTNFQAANVGRLYVNFAPITFDTDVFLIARVGVAAATFAAGNIRAVVMGEARGIK